MGPRNPNLSAACFPMLFPYGDQGERIGRLQALHFHLKTSPLSSDFRWGILLMRDRGVDERNLRFDPNIRFPDDEPEDHLEVLDPNEQDQLQPPQHVGDDDEVEERIIGAPQGNIGDEEDQLDSSRLTKKKAQVRLTASARQFFRYLMQYVGTSSKDWHWLWTKVGVKVDPGAVFPV